ncbi:Serine/threonine-protein kinase [Rhynchospora pubera]|uniref:non-specific serine/threonine protein kinase n=1 Tax=Rhynchospora pubera TaxID=906938 RepID=A0AAV8DGI3_9POAL|nr:Serine/threonine-protein kinase [Rhynchospora pubera]
MTVTIWSTNTSSLNTTMLQLSDEGNLILQASQNRVLWQSFDQPENTFIQGMHMGINTRTGARQLYTCWRRADDPTPGNFSLGLDPSGSTQVFIWKDYTVKYWRSGEWNGASNFIGIPWVPLYSKGFNFVTDNDQKYYTFTAINDSLARFVLHWNGTFSSYMYTGSSHGWDGLWHQPVKQCEIYNACGPSGLCRNNGNLASCRCLDGYQPKSAHNWRAGNWSGGCVRQAPLQCQADKKQSEYKRLPGMKLPDHAVRTSDIGDSDACKSYCSSNCSCNAYAYVTTVGCMMWSGDLIDIYHFDNGGYDFYVKVPQGKFCIFSILSVMNFF